MNKQIKIISKIKISKIAPKMNKLILYQFKNIGVFVTYHVIVTQSMTETNERKEVLGCPFKMFNPSLLNSVGLGQGHVAEDAPSS